VAFWLLSGVESRVFEVKQFYAPGSSSKSSVVGLASTLYCSLAQAPKSIALHPLLQNGRYGSTHYFGR
jgi:hypothetical protein